MNFLRQRKRRTANEERPSNSLQSSLINQGDPDAEKSNSSLQSLCSFSEDVTQNPKGRMRRNSMFGPTMETASKDRATNDAPNLPSKPGKKTLKSSGRRSSMSEIFVEKVSKISRKPSDWLFCNNARGLCQNSALEIMLVKGRVRDLDRRSGLRARRKSWSGHITLSFPLFVVASEVGSANICKQNEEGLVPFCASLSDCVKIGQTPVKGSSYLESGHFKLPEWTWNHCIYTYEGKFLVLELYTPGEDGDHPRYLGETMVNVDSIVRNGAHKVTFNLSSNNHGLGGSPNLLFELDLECSRLPSNEIDGNNENKEKLQKTLPQGDPIGTLHCEISEICGVYTNKELYCAVQVDPFHGICSPTIGTRLPLERTQYFTLDWSQKMDIYDITGDVRIYLWEHHIVRSNRCIGQVCIPLRSVLQPSGRHETSKLYHLLPYVEPKSYNRYGQYRRAMKGTSQPGFGLNRPDRPLGTLCLKVQLNLKSALALAYLYSQPEWKNCVAEPIEGMGACVAALQLNIARLERWPMIFQGAFQEALDWENRPVTAFSLLIVHFYVCICAPIWQLPVIFVAVLFGYGWVIGQTRDFSYVQAWNDEATPQDISKLSVTKKLEQQLKRMRYMAKKNLIRSEQVASQIERIINILTWADPEVTTLALILLIVGMLFCSLLLFIFPTQWVLFTFGLALFATKGGRTSQYIPSYIVEKPSGLKYKGTIYSRNWDVGGYKGDFFKGFKYEKRFCRVWSSPPILQVCKKESEDNEQDGVFVSLENVEVMDEYKSVVIDGQKVLDGSEDTPADRIRISKGGTFFNAMKENLQHKDGPATTLPSKKLLYTFALLRNKKKFWELAVPSDQAKHEWKHFIRLVSNAEEESETALRGFRKWFAKRRRLGMRRFSFASSHSKSVKSSVWKLSTLLQRVFELAPDDMDLEHQTIAALSEHGPSLHRASKHSKGIQKECSRNKKQSESSKDAPAADLTSNQSGNITTFDTHDPNFEPSEPKYQIFVKLLDVKNYQFYLPKDFDSATSRISLDGVLTSSEGCIHYRLYPKTIQKEFEINGGNKHEISESTWSGMCFPAFDVPSYVFDPSLSVGSSSPILSFELKMSSKQNTAGVEEKGICHGQIQIKEMFHAFVEQTSETHILAVDLRKTRGFSSSGLDSDFECDSSEIKDDELLRTVELSDDAFSLPCVQFEYSFSC